MCLRFQLFQKTQAKFNQSVKVIKNCQEEEDQIMSVHQSIRVAIIGAGASGILAIKACKEEIEHFSEIVCFEKTEHAGGLWKYR